MTEYVILVDPEDRPLGTMEKMEAHRKGVLHRAFSVFVFNSQGELLLHRRALDKYHSGGLWTNTCCSHPRPEESIVDAAQRRLVEEMGMNCHLEPRFSFVYRADLDHGMIEHELDHVLVGYSDVPPEPNASEVCETKYMPVDEVVNDMAKHPDRYTAWFQICLPEVLSTLLLA
ncbi:MAG: isopentenyl-diphosphate Delta-isomerase [Bacteroidetes bacterium]|nr:isopentenyl-diphosphate Delta-isomerase [Bacteroidota bacterium]MDA0903274.1 isopentenyl-diphosphate Delta-isomerase [Bacteroidota bacterium]MDA1242167.1 isopentenyl-diphosphate Delta-isomerase [Bacteroidota bacterium]